MYALIAMFAALLVLVVLLRLKVRLGQSMMLAAVALAILLKVGPILFCQTWLDEWHSKPISQTTGYLFVSLAVLLCMVNVLGLAMRETGVSGQLASAMQGLFKSRRVALSIIPMLMGLLPTPGGIMLSAPMVRDLGDRVGVDRTHCAAINYWFRHQWETVWPLFPSVPLLQSMLGIPALVLISHNLAITLAGTLGGIVFLLPRGIPPRNPEHDNRAGVRKPARFSRLLADRHGGDSVRNDQSPSGGGDRPGHGIVRAFHRSIGSMESHPAGRIRARFVLLVLGALLFKLILEAGGAIPSAVGFLQDHHAPPILLIFLLPFLVGFMTGVTMPTVAITFPFLMPMITRDGQIRMGLETLAFSGLICGLMLTPVHLCLAMSASYFQAPLGKLIGRLLGPVALVAVAGLASAWIFS
jgi:hypothetical protein